MTTTTSTAIVTDRRATPAEVAAQLTGEMLGVRARYIGRAPKSKYVHQLRRELKTLVRKKAIEFVVAIAFSDLDEGAPAAAVSGWMLSAIAIYEQRAQDRALARGEAILGPSPLALIERQNRAQHKADLVEMRIAANPNDLTALNERIALSAENTDAEDLLVANLRARRARVLANGHTMVLV
jgi:hypothetical protein